MKWNQYGVYFKWSSLHVHNTTCKLIPVFHPTGVGYLWYIQVGNPSFMQGGRGTPVSSRSWGRRYPCFIQRDGGTAILFQGDRVYSFYQRGTGTPVSSEGVGGTHIYIYYTSGYSYSSGKGYPCLPISMCRNSVFREVWKYQSGPAFCLENGRINNSRNIHIFAFLIK